MSLRPGRSATRVAPVESAVAFTRADSLRRVALAYVVAIGGGAMWLLVEIGRAHV